MFRNGSINLHLVVLEDGQLDLPVLVLDLLGGGVVLLLPLLSTSPQPEQIIMKKSNIAGVYSSQSSL